MRVVVELVIDAEEDADCYKMASDIASAWKMHVLHYQLASSPKPELLGFSYRKELPGDGWRRVTAHRLDAEQKLRGDT